MDPQLRARAEARLADAAEARGLADPRPPYRERLRNLREHHPDAFDRAIRHYEESVLPALSTSDPLPAWVEYGAFLAGLTAEGQLTAIDSDGRARTWDGAVSGDLLLFVPADTRSDVLIAAQPAAPTRAQQATIDLLVNRRLSL